MDDATLRTLEQIDHDLAVEGAVLGLEFARRSGDAGASASRAKLDALLDERLVLMLSVVRQVQPDPPSAEHGRPLRRPRRKV